MSSRFDNEASAWDKNRDIQAINKHIYDHVLSGKLGADDDILELGCGTGVLTYMAVHMTRSWLAIDTSKEMIKVLEQKRSTHDLKGADLQSMSLLLTNPAQLRQKYTWAVSALTFHHIPDMQATLDCLFLCVSQGLIIIDYQEWSDSRSFHPEDKMDGVERHGLQITQLEEMCLKAGFTTAHGEVAFSLPLIRNGKSIVFPFIAIIAQK